MRLKEYNAKRNFDVTTEPKGKIDKKRRKRFVIQFHRASHDHYDFRLEHEGVLVSWAVPKGLSENKKDKRLAIKVEDHPISYIDFKGVIPKGQYGAGTVEVKIVDSYYNMRTVMEAHMDVIRRAEEACRAVGVEPKSEPIRGGTDGARLSYMGLPCPNLSTGGVNFHGVHEYIPAAALNQMAQVLVNLVTAQ